LSPQHIREEDLELLALGVLVPEESEPFRAHLASCADCSRKFAEAHGRVALFALAAPPQTPSANARENLLQKIRAKEVHPETSGSRAGIAPRPARSRWWNSFWVPATAVLAIATILLWVNDRRLDQQLQQINQTEQDFQNKLQHEQALVSFFSAQDTQAVELNAKPTVPKSAWARVKYNSRLGMICYTGDLPAPPPNKEYQMWIVPMAGNPISAGAFMPASFSNGRMCMAKMPPGITCKDFGVTIEPMGGMPRPTGPVVLASTSASE
jgi:anti-sigma-K factor RskA